MTKTQLEVEHLKCELIAAYELLEYALPITLEKFQTGSLPLLDQYCIWRGIESVQNYISTDVLDLDNVLAPGVVHRTEQLRAGNIIETNAKARKLLSGKTQIENKDKD